MDSEEILLVPQPSEEDDAVIEFSGTICEQARQDRTNRINRIMVIPFVIIFVVLLVSAVVCLAYSNYVLFGILFSLFIVDIIFLIAMFAPNRKWRLWNETYLSTTITITICAGTVISNVSCFPRSIVKSVEKVKAVIDVGEWYYIIFKFGDIGNSWVCQKDLLTKGTIDEFEKIFEGKIVRKQK